MASSPPSASNSENSATHPTTPPPPPPPQSPPPPPPAVPPKLDCADDNGVTKVVEEKPDFSHFQILDSAEYIDKYKKYEADYTQRLMAKYFSKKDLYGGNIFDEKTTVDNETIMSSRWPCTRSFADPVRGFDEQSGTGSTSTSED